jgi:pilus assembly protein CpaE
LAESRSVLLIDLNLQFGDALSFVSESPPALTIADVARDISRLDASFLAATAVKVAPNYSVLAAPEALTEAMAIKPEHIDAIIKLALLHYDFVLLDMPRILDTLALKALDRADRIYPVLQASVPGIQNAKKLLTVFRSLGYPAGKAELIVNRFEKGGDIGLADIEQSVVGVMVRTVPNSYKEVNASINQGRALVESSRTNAVAKRLAELASTLIPQPEEEPGFLGRLFKSKA